MHEVWDDLTKIFRTDKNTYISQNPKNLSHTEEVAFLDLIWEQETRSFGDVGSENPVVRKAVLMNTRPRGGAGLQCGGVETWPSSPASAAAGRRISFHCTEEGMGRCDVRRGWGTQGGDEGGKRKSTRVAMRLKLARS